MHQLAIQHAELQGETRLIAASARSTAESVTKFVEGLDQKYAPRSRFEIVEKVVFGAAALMLVAVLGAIITGAVRGVTVETSITPVSSSP